MIDQTLLKKYLRYEPDTGFFFWIRKPCIAVNIGDRAGYVIKTAGGYRGVQLKGLQILEHRAAFLYMTGIIPDEVDHIDGDKVNNKFSNLRPCSRSLNVLNTTLRSDNISGVKGVHWDNHKRRWVAGVMRNGKRVVLGSFTDFNDAVNARKAAVDNSYNLNFYREV